MDQNNTQNYNDWMKKIQQASQADEKKEEKEEDGEIINEEKKDDRPKYSKKSTVIICLILFLIAFIPRIYFVFFVSNPDNPGAGWFGDAYHHWQIAYLTKEVGLSHGFLRLWDLKGMEYFWGLLHPLFVMASFWITGNISVGTERAMTSFMGSISVFLIFLICLRFWNRKTAIAASLFAALNPIGVFNDGTGMVEPVGIPFLLLGILLWPSRPFFAGFAFVIALMARAEYWIFSLFLIIAMVLFTKKVKADKKIVLSLSFFAVLAVYMKYLLTYTQNMFYPFYENYVANIYGKWQLKPELTAEDIQAKYIFLAIFIVSVIFSFLVVWKKPKGMFFYLLGLGNWVFLGATFGLGAYIKSYVSYVWYVRFMILPYAFLGVVLAVFLFYFIPKIKVIKLIDTLKLNWLIFFAVLIAVQGFWVLIWNKYSTTEPTWQKAVDISNGIADYYQGGGILLMDGNPEITYALVKLHHLEGKNIVGEMFDPYFYFTEDPYQDWEEKRKVVLNWLKENNIRTIVTYVQYNRYAELANREREFISEGVMVPNTNIVIFKIKDELYKQKI